jgi:hypothetical protein
MKERLVCMHSIYAPRSTSAYGAWVGFFGAATEATGAPSFEGGSNGNGSPSGCKNKSRGAEWVPNCASGTV